MSGVDDSSLPVIKDVVLGETIGQGAFACVKNAYLKVDPSVIIAVKFVHIPTCKKFGLTERDVVEEVVLHSKCCKHANILRVIDCNITKDHLWIAMEMADGGDLFDKIEPDVGVDYEVAQFYFQQLVNAISYLHLECHIAHRDIKPENILLDKNGNLKLADFGLASRFRRKDGSLRLSSDQRGSPQYMAPEVLTGVRYHPEKTDVWSIGVLVFVLLTGEVPWELPTLTDENFEEFVRNEGNIAIGQWARIEFRHLNLLRKTLQPDSSRRATIRDLRRHPWFVKQLSFVDSDGLCSDPGLLAKKLFSNLKVSLSDDEYLRFTQDPLREVDHHVSFRATQPAGSNYAGIDYNMLDLDASGSTQKPYTQYATQDTKNYQGSRWLRLIDTDIATLQFRDKGDPSFAPQFKFNPMRLTKFYSVQDMEVILPLFEEALSFAKINVKPDLYANYLNLKNSHGYKRTSPLVINVRTQDGRGPKLNGVIIIKSIREDLKSISFERKAGDPLDWRRLFKKVALFCREIILVPD